MKKVFILLLLMMVVITAFAQDVIVMKDKSAVLSKVVEITKTEIKYKKWSNPEGPTYTLDTSEVVSINYENGEVEKFAETLNSQENAVQPKLNHGVVNGKLETEGIGLKLNGKLLSKQEAQRLLDPESYQLYKSSRNMYFIGLGLVGGGLLEGGAAFLALYYDYDTLFTVLGVGALAFLIPGAVLCFVQEVPLKKAVDNFNRQQNGAVTLNIAPSMMSLDMPQFNGSYGCGMTLSVKF